MPDAMSHNLNDLDEGFTLLMSDASKVVNNFLVESFFDFHVKCIKWYDWFVSKRQMYSWLNTVCVSYETSVKAISALFYNHFEPISTSWISVSKCGSDRYEWNEVFLDTESAKSSSGLDLFRSTYQDVLEYKNSSDEFLLTMVHDGKRYVSIVRPDGPIPTTQPCEFDFILVEYHHPNMEKPVSIILPSSVYLVGNEILSKGFVLRYLEYCSIITRWEFDDKYSIRIVDQNAEPIILTSSEYLVLELYTYRVCKTDTDSGSDSDSLPDLISVSSEGEGEDADFERVEHENGPPKEFIDNDTDNMATFLYSSPFFDKIEELYSSKEKQE